MASEMTFTKGSHPDSLSPEAMYAMTNRSEKYICLLQSFRKTVNKVISQLNENEILVICGSLYFISDVRAHLLKGRA